MGLDVQVYVRVLAVACGVTYLAVFLTITCSCYPIQRNWQTIPYPPVQCTLREQNMYVITVTNVLTDAAMLCIPMPLLWKLKVPLRKKIALALLLSSGVFVITAAIVRVTESLVPHTSAITLNRWGVRETLAGILAVNAPILRPRRCQTISSYHKDADHCSVFTKGFWTGDIPSPDGVSRSHKSLSLIHI